ncbi:hypothetical protein G3H63_09270 [Microbacterium resistens]|uniref:hypothetical protein n=1 Tax=Microbacterium resistens TaxID=156977 RepID=UPI001C5A052F|nr:hypothetical protein [Microbacterium resistens]MBW1639259.1 hypothetical protein [Microbacterium resistens]
MLNLTPLADVLRLVWYAVRGGQQDALDEVESHLERLDPLRKLGADIDQRIQDAAMLEAAGVPSEDVPVIAKIWASGALTAEELHQLHERGINVAPAIDWARRTAKQTRPATSPAGPPVVIDRAVVVGVEYLVQGAIGIRHLPVGGSWTAGERPFMSRTVRQVTERWLGRWPTGRVLPTSAGEPEITEVELPAEYGPWKESTR